MKRNDNGKPPMGVIDLTGFHLLTEQEQVAKVKELLAMIA